MRPSPPEGSQRGFALLIVLWSLVLLSLLITHVTAAGRGEARIAANLRDGAGAEAAADGAVYLAVFRLMDNSPNHWGIDGAAHRLAFGKAEATVRVSSLAGKVNPNMASREMMSALLRVLGVSSGEADGLAAAINDWHSRLFQDDQRLVVMHPYRTAGLDYGPPMTPFESIDELARVHGMTPAILARLAPHLSLHRFGSPDPAYADPEVRQALQLVGKAVALPAAPAQGAQADTVAIDATAILNGARFTRHAVVSVDPTLGRGYAVLAWTDEE